MDSTHRHSRFFIISFAFQCHLKLRTNHLRTLKTSPGEHVIKTFSLVLYGGFQLNLSHL
jgi:hypothetical protein